MNTPKTVLILFSVAAASCGGKIFSPAAAVSTAHTDGVAPSPPTGGGSTTSATSSTTTGGTTPPPTSGGPPNPNTGISTPPSGPPLDSNAPPCTPGLTADVNIRIISATGPSGGAPLVVDKNLYNVNIDDQVRQDYVPTLDPNFVAYLKALHPALLRWPAGYYGQQYQWQTTGEGQFIMTPALVDSFMSLAQAVGAQPYLAINIDTGTTTNAADFVTYVNVTKGYGVTWWEIGNEPDLNGVTSTQNPQQYANTYLTFAQTLHSIDPTIKLVGAELMTGEDILGNGGDANWMTPILQTAGPQMNAIAWHYYPMDSSQTSPTSSAQPTVAHLLEEDAPDWPPSGLDFASQLFPVLGSMRDQYAPGAQLWVDEFAEDSGPAAGSGLSDRVVRALWAADALGRFAENGANALFKFIFKGETVHYYTLLDSNNNPRPEYYTYWLYAQQFGDHVVAAQSDHIAQVAAHAATRASDGSLRVVLVNKAASSQVAHLTLSDFAATSASSYQIVGDSYEGTAITLNGQTLSLANIGLDANAIAPIDAASCADNAITLPAYSVTLLVYRH